MENILIGFVVVIIIVAFAYEQRRKGSRVLKGPFLSLLASDIVISKDEITFKGNLLIEGKVGLNIAHEGDEGGHLDIAKSAWVNGNILAKSVRVAGVICGEITASEKVELAKSAKVSGKVNCYTVIDEREQT